MDLRERRGCGAPFFFCVSAFLWCVFYVDGEK